MFLHLCVGHSVHRGGLPNPPHRPPGGRPPLGWAYPPPDVWPGGVHGRRACVAEGGGGDTTTTADGMHPTGMHSCSL